MGLWPCFLDNIRLYLFLACQNVDNMRLYLFLAAEKHHRKSNFHDGKSCQK